MTAFIAVLGSLIRHALTAVGVSATVVADDVVTQIASALVTLVTLGYSIYRSIKASKKPE